MARQPDTSPDARDKRVGSDADGSDADGSDADGSRVANAASARERRGADDPRIGTLDDADLVGDDLGDDDLRDDDLRDDDLYADDVDHAGADGSGARPLPWLFREARNLAWALLVFGGIGLASSFFLTLEYIHKLQEPAAELVCDINPFITCGPAMTSWAGSVLGFPNIIIGLVSFTITVTMAMGLFAGARFRPWFWVGLQLGLFGGAVLITFLQWFSAYELARLCLWCMIIWATTIPLVVVATIYNLAHGNLGRGAIRTGRALASWAVTIVVIWYLAVIGFVVAGMWSVLSLSFI